MSQTVHAQQNRLLNVLIFAVSLAWVWRLPTLTEHLPSIGNDAQEIVWGIEWYGQQLANQSSLSPYPNTFYPIGFFAGTLAHTPTLFFLSQPFRALGGSLFALNIVVIGSFALAFFGAVKLYSYGGKSTPFTVAACAFVYTYYGSRLLRMGSHLHILIATSLLPLIALAALRYFDHVPNRAQRNVKSVAVVGILWGLAINFSLYAIFLVPFLMLAIGGKKLLQFNILVEMVAVGVIAATVSLPAIAPYIVATTNVESLVGSIATGLGSGNTLDCMVAPSNRHPLALMQTLNSDLCIQMHGEAQTFNYGILTTVLALGSFLTVRSGSAASSTTKRMKRVAIVGLLLSMSTMLMFRGQLVEARIAAPLNELIWSFGRITKPDIFTTAQLPAELRTGIPLPNLLLTAILPLYEGARIYARFGFVALIGIIWLAKHTIERLPRWLAIIVLLLWVVEHLPPPQEGHRLSLEASAIHPAHQFVKEALAQSGQMGGVIELEPDGFFGVEFGGRVLLWTLIADVPSASGVGSFMPAQNANVYRAINRARDKAEEAALYNQLNIHYVLLKGQHTDVIEQYAAAEQFEHHGCFKFNEQSNLKRTVCVLEVVSNRNVAVDTPFGWSAESWGAWAIDANPHVRFFAYDSAETTITIEAFPFCNPAQPQVVNVRTEQQAVGTVMFTEACETVQQQLIIPQEAISVGWNTLFFEAAYAIRPNEVDSNNSDPRILAFGVNKLKVTQNQ